MSKISVLIPTCNYGRFLKESLESVFYQDCEEELEVLVVDDGSTDNTRQVAEMFPQVRYIYQEHAGVSAARNRALKEATGEYLAFLDADDIWKKNKLSIQMEYLKKHPQCQIVFTAYENFLEDSVSAEENWIQECISFCERDQKCLPTALFRKQLFYQIGGFSSDLERGEDTEWSGRLQLLEIETGYIDQSLYLRRLHGKNLTQKSETENPEEAQKKRVDVMQKTLRNVGNRMKFLPDGISVVIPVWNGAAFIKECIESVKKQQKDLGNLPLEILVVDDGSEDDTVSIARSCDVIVQELPHRGAAAAKNSGMIKARYNYIFFMDADDRLTEGALKALYEPFLTKPMLMAVFSHARDFHMLKEESSGFLAEAYTETPSARVYSGCLPGCALIRKSVFRKIGLFNEEFQTGETVEWMARFRDSGFFSELIETVTLERRIHGRNTGCVLQNQEKQDYARILRERLRRKKERETK